MLDLYRSHGREIFSGHWPGRQLVMPKYSRKGFDRLLQRQFGDIHMRDLRTRRAYRRTRRSPVRPASSRPNIGRALLGLGPTRLEGGRSNFRSSDLFRPSSIYGRRRACRWRCLGQQPVDDRVDRGTALFRPRPSLSSTSLDRHRCTTAQSPSFSATRRMGWPRWARPGLALLQGGPSLGNHFQALHLLGAERYLRIGDRAESARPIKLDDVDAAQPLAALGHRTALDHWRDVRTLLDLPNTEAGAGAPHNDRLGGMA